MEIKVNNIGIVKESRILLNGLTVITGKNNSGKTTIGKALYSTVNALSNIKNNYEQDKRNYIISQLIRVEDLLFFLAPSRAERKEDALLFAQYPFMSKLIESNYIFSAETNELLALAKGLIEEFKTVDAMALLNGVRLHTRNNTKTENLLKMQYQRAIECLSNLLNVIEKQDENLDAYAVERLFQTLKIEFSNQIQPIKDSSCISSIRICSKDEDLFNITIKENKIEQLNNYDLFGLYFDNAFLIDDPYVLDDIKKVEPTITTYTRYRDVELNSILNTQSVFSHKNALCIELQNCVYGLSAFEQTVVDERNSLIKEKLDKIIPGTFGKTNDGLVYYKDGVRLNASNLATGSKMFAIIKMLLDTGRIKKQTLLVLDEPESHLHPQWQNVFAEIIVLLVKELGVKILLTTHSPNFMLAIDAFMRKYDINDKSNFYQTKDLGDGFVEYVDVTNNMEKIYQDFLVYLTEVKSIHDSFTDPEDA